MRRAIWLWQRGAPMIETSFSPIWFRYRIQTARLARKSTGSMAMIACIGISKTGVSPL
ncbi:hypothetical protein [Methanosphaerula palustris]|uniref:Uncharacterized protein n=1 Tax=Methanosphaerula palustris (strain ATCC BAA-1556 / DSM 19958 / E1-9c) TaxID=521011 RepID=B8GH12_METPE|nr:hypothetical protein [Methanosphaerula palustris]ACL16417.1 hypothetical protein Mpal_1071 [Methanosphaerula palustris E1-9c]